MIRQRIVEFSRCIRQTYGLSQEVLVSVIKAQDRYTPRFRAAALRNLVCDAPVSVTGGAPYAARRRAVRRFYQV
ncbi:hypothetical protein [Paraburkholderia hospita]|uniref:hypothetical protein n=1 Tax=Paraburkholderia hospita TaxID=169430 RepID=UPI0008A7DE95|nr:hypothetical protein [Paraburkholderia hospita]SEI23837.1 hypothetical protein SAMN05192544_104962 [Paraburkholderia hospita]